MAIAGLACAAGIAIRHGKVEQQIELMRTDPNAILASPALRETALSRGADVYRVNCASCHGPDGKGDSRSAIPDLTDDDFLYGTGTVAEIEQITLHGIRAGDTKGWNLAEMPGFAKAVPYNREPLPFLEPGQIDDIVAFLRAANGSGNYDRARVERGKALFTAKAGCWDCHGADGAGDNAIGAPNLIDGKWLKGDGSEADIRYVLEHGLANVSPAFGTRLSAYDVRAVSAYVASLHPPSP